MSTQEHVETCRPTGGPYHCAHEWRRLRYVADEWVCINCSVCFKSPDMTGLPSVGWQVGMWDPVEQAVLRFSSQR